MRQTMIIGVLAAALLTSPSFCHAQYDDESQNPKEYNEEDSQPLKLIATILSPVGFLLEWTIARPLHYLSTESSLSPVFGGGNDFNDFDSARYSTVNIPAPIAEMPSSDMPPANASELEGSAPRANALQSGPQTRTAPLASGAPPQALPSGSQQPVLH
jgi:hypothetical protein